MRDIRERYESRLLSLRQVAESLSTRTSDALKGISHIDRVSFRAKDTKSFVTKATEVTNEGRSRYERPLVEIEDQVAGRVLVFFTADLPIVKDALLAVFRPVEVTSKKPQKDDAFGYQSEHLIMMIPPWAKPRTWGMLADAPTTFEMQLRTLFMHAYAEPQHDMSYKAIGDLSADARRELAWIAASAWGADAALTRVRTAIGAHSIPDAPPGA